MARVVFRFTLYDDGLMDLRGRPMKGPLNEEFPQVLRMLADAIESGAAVLEPPPDEEMKS